MSEPQSGIIPEPNESALFLVLGIPSRAQDGQSVARGLTKVPALLEATRQHDTQAGLVCTVGVGSELWDTVSPSRRPHKLQPFRAIEGSGGSAPSTGGDVIVHIVSKRHDLNFELAAQIRNELGDSVDPLDEVHGFRYLDSRDLTGFIDGTENPAGAERAEVALIGQEDPEFAGSSYIFTQRYVHDLGTWSRLAVSDQEHVIGRTKPDSVELADKLPTSHIGRVVVEEAGQELEILRHSFPYGTTSEAGLFFIAYTKDLDIPHKMLHRMMGTAGDGHHDHLMHYSHAVSGANFFAPSLALLASFA